jgi:hypothetical protein
MSLKLSPGDWVEIRSKEEILATLDKRGLLDGMPFMPQMFQYCGRRYQVFKRAHKTCDTVNQTGGRWVKDSLHLNLRCDGAAYGGCQAACLLFWKEAWVKSVKGGIEGQPGPDASPIVAPPKSSDGCTERDVLRATRAPGQEDNPDPNYTCQATELPKYTSLAKYWDLRQYIEDFTSGNATFGQIFRGFIYANFYNLSRLGIGLGKPMRWFYVNFQKLYGGLPYPRWIGSIPAGKPTPAGEVLNLQPGELVRVKSYKEILATVDTNNKNKGLYFDAEAVPYCGGTYRVHSRISKILDEKTGKMVKMKNESIVLENVYCRARYSDCRMFCPRAIYSYWREIWLERVEEPKQGKACESSGKSKCQELAHTH